jgi:hypothetical protein
MWWVEYLKLNHEQRRVIPWQFPAGIGMAFFGGW